VKGKDLYLKAEFETKPRYKDLLDEWKILPFSPAHPGDVDPIAYTGQQVPLPNGDIGTFEDYNYWWAWIE
jgi:hypothetical protein